MFLRALRLLTQPSRLTWEMEFECRALLGSRVDSGLPMVPAVLLQETQSLGVASSSWNLTQLRQHRQLSRTSTSQRMESTISIPLSPLTEKVTSSWSMDIPVLRPTRD